MVRISYLLVIVTGVALGLFLLERLFPLRMATQALIGRLATNLCISGLVFGVAAITIRPVLSPALRLVGERSIGLLHLIYMPTAMRQALACVWLDLSFYDWPLKARACWWAKAPMRKSWPIFAR
jgi:hypothetical protein